MAIFTPLPGRPIRFPETVAALLNQRTVTYAVLARFVFLSETVRLWMGPGPLLAGGEIWLGDGGLGSISDLEVPRGDQAPQVTFTLSGVDEDLIDIAANSSAEVKGRDVTVFAQFYDDDLSRLDNPLAIYAGVMDTMFYDVTGPDLASISLTAETRFARRAFAICGRLQEDQRYLFPLDRALDFTPRIPSKTATWPKIVPP